MNVTSVKIVRTEFSDKRVDSSIESFVESILLLDLMDTDTTLSSLQHHSPASPLQPMTYVNQHQNQNENNLVSGSSGGNFIFFVYFCRTISSLFCVLLL